MSDFNNCKRMITNRDNEIKRLNALYENNNTDDLVLK
jgi:hypothetical protein